MATMRNQLHNSLVQPQLGILAHPRGDSDHATRGTSSCNQPR